MMKVLVSIIKNEEEIVYLRIRLMKDTTDKYERDDYPHSVSFRFSQCCSE